jgi:hypothetical protein
MLEGQVDQENVDILSGNINLSEEVPRENRTSESQQGSAAGSNASVNA